MTFALLVDHWLFQALGLLAVALEVWALSDALRRSPGDFLAAGQREKRSWLLFLGAALAVGVLGLVTGGGLGMFSLVAACVASVYLAGPRGQMPRTAR